MFIPLFIAILLGLVTPSANSQNASPQGSTIVSVNGTDPVDPNNPSDSGDASGDDDTGGEHGHMPPPKVN